MQAWRLGRTLDATLDAAFGAPPVAPPCTAFSLAAAVVPRNPAPVAIETMQYADGLMLDFYRPTPPPGAAGRSPRPCVVVIHGGSWVHGNRLDLGTKRWLNDWLAVLGYAVASIDYRLSPQFQWPAQRDDLLAAVRFLRDHAGALGIDGDRLVLVGRSAGAQMATAAAYAEVIPGVRGIVDIYGPTDFDLTWDAATRPRSLDHRYNLEVFLSGSPETTRRGHQQWQGATPLVPARPMTLILHGGLDINVFPRADARCSTGSSPRPACRTRWCRCRGPATRSTWSTSTRPARRSEGMRSCASWRASRDDRATGNERSGRITRQRSGPSRRVSFLWFEGRRGAARRTIRHPVWPLQEHFMRVRGAIKACRLETHEPAGVRLRGGGDAV